MSEVVLGIDLGSTGARAVALARDGGVRLWARRSFSEAASQPAGRGDPSAWLEGLGRLLSEVGGAGLSTAAIGIGGQSPTTVPVAPSRAGGALSADRGAGALGMAVTCRHPVGNGLARLPQYMAQRDLLERELGYRLEGAEIWDWALWRLGAGRVQGVWPGEDPLPGYGEPVAVGAVAGHSDGSLGVAAGTPLVCGYNDAYMSFWAGGLGVSGRGHDPGGRTGGLGVAVAARDRPAEMIGFQSPVAGVEVVGGPVNGHGEALDWWSAVSGRGIGELLELAAEVPPGAGGALMLPYHGGERAPRWSPGLRGEIRGLSFRTGTAEIARAVLEGTAHGLRHISESLRESGVPMEVMGCGGSPARSRLWCEIKASVLRVPVEVPERPEQLSAHGCALAAGAAVGWWDGVGAADMDSWPIVPMTRIDPSPDPAVIRVYSAGYERFIAAGDDAAARLCRSQHASAGGDGDAGR